MDIFSIINLLGGLALFLYGMSVMSQGLEKLAGGKLEGILRSMTSNKFKSRTRCNGYCSKFFGSYCYASRAC